MAKEKRNIKAFRAFTGRINAVFASGKMQNKGGFTLLEVLVVVLIIGILTSIALPQYTKSVEKARAAQALQAVAQLRDAQIIFRDTYGRWATLEDLDLLDLSFPSVGTDFDNRPKLNKYFCYTPMGGNPNNIALLERIPVGDTYYLTYHASDNLSEIYCGVYEKAPAYIRQMCNRINTYGNL